MLRRLFGAAALAVAIILLSPIASEAKKITPGSIVSDFKRCVSAEMKGRKGCHASGVKRTVVRHKPKPVIVKKQRSLPPDAPSVASGETPAAEIETKKVVVVDPPVTSLEERTRLPKSIEPKLAKGGNLRAMAERHATAAGVPVALALKVVAHESGWKPGVTGKAGEVGLMQIKLSTARGIGYRGTRKQLYQPDVNLRWGMKYLAGAHRLAGGDTCGTLSRYNAGHGFKGRRTGYCRKVLAE